MVKPAGRRDGSRADQVYDALRAEFGRGEWSFGQTFSTYQLAERFGVSRQPVMDAVQRLESDGYIEIIPQVGCRVVSPEKSRIRDHLDLSAALEGRAAGIAASRASEADVDRLEHIRRKAELAVEEADFEEYRRLNHEFHAAILDIVGNPALASLAAAAWDLSEFYFHGYRHLDPSVLVEREADHEQILEAIRTRDRDAARAAMEAHLDPERGLELLGRIRKAAGDTHESDVAPPASP